MSPSNSKQTDEKNDEKRVCCHCKLDFKNAKALGGHIRTHYKDRRKTNFTRKKRKRTSKRNTQAIDLSKSLPGFGWKVQKKRNGNRVTTNRFFSGDYEGDDEYETDGEDGFTILDRLAIYGVDDNGHQISRTKSLFVCYTCNIYFATFSGVLDHVNDHCSSSGSIG